jgi:ABC-2 type transport system ATP-binding protein
MRVNCCSFAFPQILFLDEPTIGLDVVSQKKIRDFILEYNQKEKTTIILSSHYMEDVKALCGRIIIIDLGKIIYDGSLKDLTKRYADKKWITITFRDKIKTEDLVKFGKIIKYGENRAIIEVDRTSCSKIAALILDKFPIDDVLIAEEKIDNIVRGIFTKGL